MKLTPKRSKTSLALLLALVFSTHAPRASAQETVGFASNRYEPSERGSEWFYGDSLDFRGKVRPAFGVVFDWAHNPLVIENSSATAESTLIENQFFAHAGASLVLWERLRLSASLPIALYQNGEPANVDGEVILPPDRAAVGDLRLGADLRLLGEYRSPFSLAAGMRVWAPTGSRDQFTGDGAYRLGGHVIAAGEVGLFAYSARIGAIYRDLQVSYGNSELGTDLPFGVAAGVRLLDGDLLLGPELHGSTVLSDMAFRGSTTPMELLFGGHYTIDCIRVGAGVGPGLTVGIGSPQVRTLLSLEYVMPAPEKDADHDGFSDDRDRCPHESGTEQGCPVAKDTDADTILDPDDACPTEFGLRSADPAKNGCPEVADQDGDGVVDSADRCPEIAASTADGCPSVVDTDGDTILDKVDACPDRAGPEDADPKKNGCPLLDADRDGVPDDVDACPNAAGAADGDQPGCPLAQVVGDQVNLSRNIEFEAGSSTILTVSDGLLTDIGRAIRTLPPGGRVRIEGHTDSVGTNQANRKLAQQRADAVRSWLIDRGGIAAEALEAVGIGEERPIASNDTPEGRAKNRRVEFHVVDGS